MPQLLAIAEYITKTRAICMVCGNPANHTQRLVGTSRRSRAAGRAGHLRGPLPALLRSHARRDGRAEAAGCRPGRMDAKAPSRSRDRACRAARRSAARRSCSPSRLGVLFLAVNLRAGRDRSGCGGGGGKSGALARVDAAQASVLRAQPRHRRDAMGMPAAVTTVCPHSSTVRRLRSSASSMMFRLLRVTVAAALSARITRGIYTPTACGPIPASWPYGDIGGLTLERRCRRRSLVLASRLTGVCADA